MSVLGNIASGTKLALHSKLAAGLAVAGVGAVVADRQMSDGRHVGGVAAPIEAGVFGLFGLGIAGQATSPLMRAFGIAEAAIGLSIAATSGGLGVYDAIRGTEQHSHLPVGGGGSGAAHEAPKAGFNADRSVEVQVGPQPHGGTYVQLQYSDGAGQPAAKEQATHVEVTEFGADGTVAFHTSGTMAPTSG